MGDTRNAYKIFISKLERNRPIEIPKRGWKIILKCNTRCTDLVWIHPSQWRALVNTVLNIYVSYSEVSCLATLLNNVSASRSQLATKIMMTAITLMTSMDLRAYVTFIASPMMMMMK
jgi:hypothetical protein